MKTLAQELDNADFVPVTARVPDDETRDDAFGLAGKIIELLDDPVRRAEIRAAMRAKQTRQAPRSAETARRLSGIFGDIFAWAAGPATGLQ